MLPYERNLKSRAQAMRKDATPQENKLWYSFLRKHPVPLQDKSLWGATSLIFYAHQAETKHPALRGHPLY